MSMFDQLRCDYPLPVRPAAQGVEFQTKSLDCLMLNYHIRADGTLWVEDYDTEDHSDPSAEGIARMFGMLAQVNHRWRFVDDFTGEIEFSGGYGKRNKNGLHDGDVELMARFEAGQLISVALVKEIASPTVLAEEQAQQIDQATDPASARTPKTRL